MSKLKFVLLAFLLAGCTQISPSSFESDPVASDSADDYVTNLDVAEADDEVAVVDDQEQPAEIEIVNEEVTRSQDLGSSSSEYVNYPVPFSPQAPYAVWDALHQEACEEASIKMVHAYFNGEPLNAHLMEQSILEQVRWQTDNGYKVDLTADELAFILESQFGLSATVTDDISISNLKQNLLDGKLIIVPAAGQELANPYFSNAGPVYHMVAIRGFDESNFITNDPGTYRGEGFKYEFEHLIESIHDWPRHLEGDDGQVTPEQMQQGRKVVVIVEPGRPN